MYANKAQIAKEFGLSYSAVQSYERGIQKEIGKRYNQYAIIGKLISKAVFADYVKYRNMLSDKNLRKCVPEFNMHEATRYIMTTKEAKA